MILSPPLVLRASYSPSSFPIPNFYLAPSSVSSLPQTPLFIPQYTSPLPSPPPPPQGGVCFPSHHPPPLYPSISTPPSLSHPPPTAISTFEPIKPPPSFSSSTSQHPLFTYTPTLYKPPPQGCSSNPKNQTWEALRVDCPARWGGRGGGGGGLTAGLRMLRMGLWDSIGRRVEGEEEGEKKIPPPLLTACHGSNR